jgi:hypothetical protein
MISSAQASSLGDGVLTTEKKPVLPDSVRQSIETYVHQAVSNAYIKLAGKVFANVLSQSKTEVLPQIEYQFGQRAALEALKHPAIKKVISDSSEQGVKIAIEQHNQRVTQDVLQRRIMTKADFDIQGVLREPVFRLVMQQMIPRAIQANNEIVSQQVAQQRAELSYIQQQQRSTERAIQQEILQTSFRK